MPMFMNEIQNALESCELFVAIGTSGKVYPAAGFAEDARKSGAETLLLNKEHWGDNKVFDRSVIGAATEIVPAWVDSILAAK